jgi:hypothetical protein
VNLSDEVLRKIELTWSTDEDRERARQVVAMYGTEDYERERDRVQLAALKLSAGSIDRLVEMVQMAKTDYRDVLMWAEYPEEGQALWTLRPGLSPEEQQRLAEIRKRDRTQYDDWRGR